MQQLGYKTVHAIGKRENLEAKNGSKTDNPPYEGSIWDLTAGDQGFFGAGGARQLQVGLCRNRNPVT